MKKTSILVLFLFFLIFIIPLTSSQTNSSDDKIQRAYQCVSNQLINKSISSISLQEAIFGILALGEHSNLIQKIESEKNSPDLNQTCWPKSGCRIKDTAQVLLAYRSIGRNTLTIENWLLSKVGATSGLNWFLEIDIENQRAGTCTINYTGTPRTINIGDDMRITGDPGNCLSITPQGYWLAISPLCFDRSFEISCNRGFITTLLYQKSGSEIIYVSPRTQSAASQGTTTESIQSRCFKIGNNCDYEGSLWATIALDTAQRSTGSYMPYLVAFSQENENFLPNSFLYKLSMGQDYFSTLTQSQINNQFWRAPLSAYNQFYDTALAIWALQGDNAGNIFVDNSKNYLLSVQGSNGCWNNNNLRDTSFILYAAWPNLFRRTIITNVTNNQTSTGGVENCLRANPLYSCQPSTQVCESAGGRVLGNYFCSGSLICCSVTPERQTCPERNGVICPSNKVCEGTQVSTQDGLCCLGECVSRNISDACTLAGGTCASFCDEDTEREGTEACSINGRVCCFPRTGTDDETTTVRDSRSLLWIIILVALIIIILLAIIFRKRLQLLFLKFRKGGGVSSYQITKRPSYPPTSSPITYTQSKQQYFPPQRRPVSQVDKELEETLKKLREVTK